MLFLSVFRSDILMEQKQRLQGEIDDLQTRKRLLTEKAHELAEKYEEANDKKSQLIDRFVPFSFITTWSVHNLPLHVSPEEYIFSIMKIELLF